jgi:hypothetical protein
MQKAAVMNAPVLMSIGAIRFSRRPPPRNWYAVIVV